MKEDEMLYQILCAISQGTPIDHIRKELDKIGLELVTVNNPSLAIRKKESHEE